jgi:hypothetical protein
MSFVREMALCVKDRRRRAAVVSLENGAVVRSKTVFAAQTVLIAVHQDPRATQVAPRVCHSQTILLTPVYLSRGQPFVVFSRWKPVHSRRQSTLVFSVLTKRQYVHWPSLPAAEIT